MTFKEFKDQATADIVRAVREEMPPFYAQLKADAEARLAEPGGLEAVELEMVHRVEEQVYRFMLEWMLRTAAKAPEICPACDQLLEQVKRDLEREMVLKTGKVKLRRSVGWCPRCEKWRCPTDAVLGATEISGSGQAGLGLQK